MKKHTLILLVFVLWFSIYAGLETTVSRKVVKAERPTIDLTWSYSDDNRTTISFEIFLEENGIDGIVDCQSIIISLEGFVFRKGSSVGTNVCQPLKNRNLLVTATFDGLDNLRSELSKNVVEVNVDLSNLRWFANSSGTILTSSEEKVINLGIFTEQVALLEDQGRLSFVGNLNVEENSVILLVKKIYVNPTFTQVNSCIELPNNKDWIPDASLVDDSGNQTRYAYWKLLDYKNPLVQSGSYRCYDFFFDGDFTKDAIEGELLFVLTEIKTSIPDNLLELRKLSELTKQTLQEQGLRYHIKRNEQSHEIVIDKKPYDLTYEDAVAMVVESLIIRVTGNWSISWE